MPRQTPQTPTRETTQVSSRTRVTIQPTQVAPVLTPLGAQILEKMSSAYSDATQNGPLTDESAQQAAQSVIKDTQPTISYQHFSASDLQTTNDISKDSAMAYRAALQVSLKPLLSIPEAEFATYGRYVQTKDPTYLTQLQNDADIYRSAIAATAQVTVPEDAVPQQIAILNAMGEFASTLDALVQSAQDPLASAVLLTSYNQAEDDMLGSFNSLASYYKSKI